MTRKRSKRSVQREGLSDCFVIMPISDPEGYANGHFRRVYEDIFAPACVAAGFRAVRADQVKATNLIHLDVLKRLLEAPMALCDLSNRNPNVLFELGIRQAFDKPVVLVQESGTPQIFDIAPLRYTEYRRARLYHEVIEDQENIAEALKGTAAAKVAKDGVNSLVKLLSLTAAASLPTVSDSESPVLQLVRAELSDLRRQLEKMSQEGKTALDVSPRSSLGAVQRETIERARKNLRWARLLQDDSFVAFARERLDERQFSLIETLTAGAGLNTPPNSRLERSRDNVMTQLENAFIRTGHTVRNPEGT